MKTFGQFVKARRTMTSMVLVGLLLSSMGAQAQSISPAPGDSDDNWRDIGTVTLIDADTAAAMIMEFEGRQQLEPSLKLEGMPDPEMERLIAVNANDGRALKQKAARPHSRDTEPSDSIARVTDELAAPLDIVGSDNRNLYLDMQTYPHRTIGGIAPRGSHTSGCTGALVGPRHVLTAGHCIHPGGGGIDNFYSNRGFAPGWRGRGDTLTQKPHGHYNPVWYFAPEGWWEHGDSRYDYAIIVLEDNPTLRSLGWFGTTDGTVGNLTQQTIRNRGYPGADRSCSASPVGAGPYQGTCSNYMYGMSCNGIAVGVYQFSHNCDTQGGQSGSPLYKNDHNIYGIHTHAGTTFNWAIRMRNDVQDMIHEARDTFN